MTPDPEPGISVALAAERARTIQGLRYELSFVVPSSPDEPIAGRATIRFARHGSLEPLVLDFAPGADHLTKVSVGGRQSPYRAVNGHIVILPEMVPAGDIAIELVFRAGDLALNRAPEFLYTLFVPARAHLTFPCFDQPDLKARFALELVVPSDWQSVTNAAEASRERANGQVRIRYSETEPISTYLFAFAAGMFRVETADRGGRTLRMFHREKDAVTVARNRDVLFDLHAFALSWLEVYTGLPYPFGKFDFALIPSFQFSGMEHPGAIFYNAESMLLEESATENQVLNRASTIAHETAHMWFGDLVTMRWFDDVWVKEVFASFMAAKIVNPAFPHLDHRLRFLLAHYPAAYDVDRTEGTHSIRQPLDNLSDAGGQYGAIIYKKAPIVMRQLELLVGPDRLRDGLRAYLNQFQFGNASWLDLVDVLNKHTGRDLTTWSRVWIEEAGRPTVRTDLRVTPDGGVDRINFLQTDSAPDRRQLLWPQRMEVIVGAAGAVRSFQVELDRDVVAAPEAAGLSDFQFVLPTGGGLAYGDFVLDDATGAYLLEHLLELEDPVTRGAAWVTLWEEMLGCRVAPATLVTSALRALPREDVQQIVQLIVNYLREIYWRFLSPSARQALAPAMETALRDGMARAAAASLKATYFDAFRSTALGPEAVAWLERVWAREEQIPGLALAEPDEATLALELAVRSVPQAGVILEEQLSRFTSADRRERFQFVMPALSDRTETRDAFFARLANVKNRRREPWVIEGLSYLNHPLRAAQSAHYVYPALELLPEIQRTGDIFFPKNWTDAVLHGHNTADVADTVRKFLIEHTDYPLRLRRIILQPADGLFRAVRILSAPGG